MLTTEQAAKRRAEFLQKLQTLPLGECRGAFCVWAMVREGWWPLVSCAGIRGRGRLCGPEGYRPGPYRHTRQSPGLSGKGQHQRNTPGRSSTAELACNKGGGVYQALMPIDAPYRVVTRIKTINQRIDRQNEILRHRQIDEVGPSSGPFLQPKSWHLSIRQGNSKIQSL